MAIDKNNPLTKYQGATYGQAAGYGIQDLTSLIMSALGGISKTAMEPVAAPARALGALSEQRVGDNPMQAIGQAVAKVGPYAEGVKKALKESGYNEATEAKMSGVPADFIEQQAGLSPQMNPGQLQNSPYQQGQTGFGQQPNLNQLLIPGVQQQQSIPQAQQQNPLQVVGGLLNNFFGETPAYMQAKTQKAVAEQQMSGQQPLQKGEREKIGLETQKELMKQQMTNLQDLQKRGMLTAKDMLDTATNDPIIKDYNASTMAMSEFNELFKDKTGASDMAMIFKFMKALDPASTVREGEAASARDVSGAGAKFLNLYNSVVGGRKLDESSRKQLMSALTQTVKGKKSSFENRVKELTAVGNRSGISAETYIPQVAERQSRQTTQPYTGKLSSGLSFTLES